MSITVGFGYSSSYEADLFLGIRLLAEKFGYGLIKGTNSAEADVLEGLIFIHENQNWDHIFLLQAPKNSGNSLAFGLHEELINFELTGKRPIFFGFLEELGKLCEIKCQKLAIFFASEWRRSDKIRFSYGLMHELIFLLSMPGNWGGRYLIPETGTLQDYDEVPFLFDVKLS